MPTIAQPQPGSARYESATREHRSVTEQKLQIKLVDGPGRPIRLGPEPVTIGRHPDNRLRIQDDRASRHHCIIEQDPDRAGVHVLRDLGSRNGTTLNGEPVDARELDAGDQIGIGKLAFRIERVAPPDELEDARDTETDTANGTPARATRTRRTQWEKALWSVIENATSEAPKDESHTLLDARGNESEALEGKGDGPLAVRLLLRAARRTTATDIHVEPKGENTAHVRMRVDGVMIWIAELPKSVHDRAAGLIKTACEMKQAARDAIQEGHFTSRFNGRRVEYRVSFTPSVYGQKLVVRVLDQINVPTSIADLGLVGYMRDKLESVTNLDAGMLIACGPTGSGKTTTLYNALRQIDRESRNVITIEDPVEYQIEGVTQIPVDDRTGKGFADLLRSVLRQDPDVILLGEIRDEDTARTAMQAAMTGHLVFSTVHAKDTITAIYRLLDLRVEPYLVANSVSLLLAQRLVRKLCTHCARPTPVTPGLVNRMGKVGSGLTEVHAATGCKHCLRTGYRGRHGLFELLEITDELRDVILGEASIQAMRRAISSGHFTTLAEFGWKLVAQGVTSVEEVERVAGTT